VVIVLAASLLPNYRLVGAIPLAYAIIVSGALIHNKRLRLRTDLSYGVYIYAFPIQQLLVIYWLGSMNPIVFAIIATIATLPLARWRWCRRRRCRRQQQIHCRVSVSSLNPRQSPIALARPPNVWRPDCCCPAPGAAAPPAGTASGTAAPTPSRSHNWSIDLAGVRGGDHGHPVDGGRLVSSTIAGAAAAHSSGGGRRQQSAACQPRASARSASAPITGANSREYSTVR
jgi:hypothetical protein